MDDETKNAIELETRRLIGQTFAQEVTGYRAHLETQFNFLKTSIGIVAAAGAAIFIFLIGRSWLDMDTAIQGKVDAVFAQAEVEKHIGERASAVAQSAEVKKVIDKRVGEAVERGGTISLEPIIKEKEQELSKIDVKSLLVSPPLGTVIASVLEPAKMSSDQWVLADGRDVSGTPYATLASNNHVPDLRGLFLRGINVGRTDAFADPGGERRPFDQPESQDIKSHVHQVGLNGGDSTTMVPGGGSTPRLAQFNDDAYGGGPPKFTSATGGKETRPSNVAVYYYIKVR